MTHNPYIDGAVQIADRLVAATVKQDVGLAWESISFLGGGEFGLHVADSFYSGVAGICYFLDEVTRQSGKQIYRDTASEGLKWLMHHYRTNPVGSTAALTGTLSGIWPFLRRAQAEPGGDDLANALELARKCADVNPMAGPIDDYINGRIGSVLAFLHLYDFSGEEWLLTPMMQLVEEMIDRALPYEKGLAWERSGTQTQSLTGFSHGAGGVGFVMTELAWYFNLPGFQWLADQAFAYEDQFIKKFDGWPDFRCGMYEDKDETEHLDNLRSGNLDFFYDAKPMVAWCHGAPGIALARARAYERTGESRWLDTLKLAVEKSHVGVVPDASGMVLCHGRGGNADAYLEAERVLADPSYREPALEPAKRILENLAEGKSFSSGFRDSGDEDPSLFMGNAGIGYYMLRIANPEEVPSVLAPHLPKPTQKPVPDALKKRATDATEIRQRAFSNVYARTIGMAASLAADVLATAEQQIPADLDCNAYAEQVVAAVSPHLKGNVLAAFQTIYRVEKDAFLWDRQFSFALANVRRLANSQLMAKRKDDDDATLNNRRLVLNPQAKLSEYPWYWPNAEAQPTDFTKPEDDCLVMMLSLPELQMEEELDMFVGLVLDAFSGEGKAVHSVLDEAVAAFETSSDEEEAHVRKLTLQQIREALESGILYYADYNA